jgi:hypothetical protein
MTRLAGDTEAAAEAGVTGDLRVSMERWAAYVRSVRTRLS